MTTKKIGTIIIPPGVFVNVHEKRTADYLATHLYHDITFLVPNRQKGRRTPDIEMDGVFWEIKGPKGRSSRTIENNLRAALRQSPNIILDLRRMDGRTPTQKYLQEIERRFNDAKSMKRLIVITKGDFSIALNR
ncbi:MAG TPA: hypothetical protein VFQ70_01830 [Candidatus Saccharimonadaceae bacterium]|nr:hypothetical protein [Candidatus Saccharimonadaceae bacterium]